MITDSKNKKLAPTPKADKGIKANTSKKTTIAKVSTNKANVQKEIKKAFKGLNVKIVQPKDVKNLKKENLYEVTLSEPTKSQKRRIAEQSKSKKTK